METANDAGPVATSPVGGTCKSCLYGNMQKQPNGKMALLCKRNPPMPLPLPGPPNPLTGQPSITTLGMWPPVGAEEWCGEYRSRVAS